MRNEIQTTPSHRKHEQHGQHVYETGQLRRAKMHAGRLIGDFDSRKILSPSLLQLLETSIILQTTDSKILACHLKRKPAVIRADLQKICQLLAERPKP